MAEALHSPGPWHVSSITPFLVVQTVGPDPEHPGEELVRNVAVASSRHPSGLAKYDPEAMANARVIALAPELLAFVERIAKRDPVFAKGQEKQVIREAISLVLRARDLI